MKASAKRSAARWAMLYCVACLPPAAFAQRLERPASIPAPAKPAAATAGAPSPYGHLAPITQPYVPPTPRQLDALIAFPALPLSTFATTPDATPDHFRPPPSLPSPSSPPPPPAWTPPPVPPPRAAAESRRTPRPVKVVRRSKAPSRPGGAPVTPVTMPSLLEPTWH